MTDDRFKDTGSFHPDKAWSEIQRKDWERKTEKASRWGGWIAFGGVIALLGVLACIGSLAFGLF